MTLTIRQRIASVAVFLAVLLMLVYVDDRVRDRFADVASPEGGLALASRTGEVSGALVTAAKYQSIDNAPLLIFAVVGAVLVVFMVKT